MTQITPETHQDKPDHPPKKVVVTVDGKEHHVRPGTYSVAEFKREVKVDLSLDLDQVINGVLTPVPNDSTIEIKGGEVFISHQPQGGSS
jgi:hypothetical protein